MFGGGDVESGIHRIASEFHIAAVLDGEGLQRDDGQRVFHLTVGEGVTTCEVDAFVIVSQAQVAATHQVDVVALFSIEVTEDTGSLRHADCQVGLDTSGGGTGDNDLGGIAEVCELYQLVETVVGRQWRIEQHIGHVCRT